MRTDEFKARLQAWYDDELRHAHGVIGEAAGADFPARTSRSGSR